MPSSGYCEIDELVPWNERIRHVARIGVVFGQRTQLWWDLPVIDSFELLRDIYRVPEVSFRATAESLISLLRIDQLLHQPVRQLSLGQRMRCDIAAAMLHSPSILFLDEPTIGLDANSKLALRDFIKNLNRDKGVTVILATHDMQDIGALAERVLIIGNGRILRDGSIAAMRAETPGERRLVIDFSEEIGDIAVEGVTVLSRTGRRVELAFDPRVTAAHTLISRLTAEHSIEELAIEEPTIEELIARNSTHRTALSMREEHRMLDAFLRPYFAIFSARFLMMLQYRAAALAGIATQFWFGAIMIMALSAFYTGDRGSAPITLAEAITYVWLGQAFLGLLPWNVDPEIALMMRTGNVAYERLRPLDTYFYWFARAMAWRVAATLLRSIPLLFATSVLFEFFGLGALVIATPSKL